MSAELYSISPKEIFRGTGSDESESAAEKMLLDVARVPDGKTPFTSGREPGGEMPDGKTRYTSPLEPGGKVPFEKPSEPIQPYQLEFPKCYDDSKFHKPVRFALPSEMQIDPVDTLNSMVLPSGEKLTQKGSNQRLSLRDGSSIDVNGDGTFAVRDANGDRIPFEIVMIKPAPGVIPRGQYLAFGDNISAHVVDGTINVRTADGASIDVDSRGFASLSRTQSLRFEDQRKK